MRKMTEANLLAAFAGESQAHMKYGAFALMAEKKGMPNLARVFRAAARAEEVHAMNHLRELGMVGTAAENIKAAIEGETFEIDEMYPAYEEVAKLQKENGALRSIRWALETEKKHAELFRKALSAIEAGGDAPDTKEYVCPICGYTVDGEAPDNCPLCGAPRDKFIVF
jgi:rubrerythrin